MSDIFSSPHPNLWKIPWVFSLLLSETGTSCSSTRRKRRLVNVRCCFQFLSLDSYFIILECAVSNIVDLMYCGHRRRKTAAVFSNKNACEASAGEEPDYGPVWNHPVVSACPSPWGKQQSSNLVPPLPQLHWLLQHCIAPWTQLSGGKGCRSAGRLSCTLRPLNVTGSAWWPRWPTGSYSTTLRCR